MCVAGLRERKKERTRREISDVATKLFIEHGFEEVTLAQIADAAEVSVKTIFNHFGSKEDLYFDRAGEVRAALTSTIVDRPPGTTAVQAVHGLMRDNVVPFPGRGWGGLDDPLFRGFILAQERSPALRARRLTLGLELHEHLRGVLADDLGRDRDDPALVVLVAMLGTANQLRDQTLRQCMALDLSPRATRRRVVAVVDEAFGRIATAFADLDRQRRAVPEKRSAPSSSRP